MFDGKPSELKLETIQKRREVKEEAKKKMVLAQESEDFREARKYAQQTSKLTSEMLEESKKLIGYLGVPIIQAVSEGEAQSAYLVENNDAWAIASQDYDTLLFGGQRLVRNFAVSRSKKVKDTKITLDIEYITLAKVLEKLDINREQLVEMAILIGVDFFPGIKGIGQHTALELIKKYGSIENLIKNKVSVGKNEIDIDIEQANDIKRIFLEPEVSKDYPKPKWDKINYEKVEELLIETHNFSKQRVMNALERLKKIDSSKIQVSLDSFFKKNE